MVTIYALICQANGKAYVGSTKAKLAKRFREHRCLLNSGTHQCSGLLADWRERGPEGFCIVELEIFLFDDSRPRRREAELKWMDFYAEKDALYNEHRISMQPDEAARIKGVANAHLKPGLRWTAEANEKRRKAQLGIPKGHGAKISATKRARRQVMR
jgi:hypothetical protein